MAVRPPAATAQTGQFAGLDSLRVVVSGVTGEAPERLTADTVRRQIGAVLAGRGIAVDSAETSATPALRVGFSIRRLEGGWVIGVRAEVVELGVSLREYVREVSRRLDDPARGAAQSDSVLGDVRRNLTTWSRFVVATCGTDAGYDTALAVVEQLAAELAQAVANDNPGG
ncbi:MAG TPA: hypothetical protein VFH97_04225 [Gemmatimonadales bacterium]|nr:hypothetical protein [Gemmatimonadales bacterium]